MPGAAPTMQPPDALPPAPARLREQQFALTRHLRDPGAQPAPPGIDDRRLAVYRDLLFNNIEGLLAGNFPVMRGLLGEPAWKLLVRAFYRDHRCQTPLFPEIAQEFLHFLETRAAAGGGDPPFLAELAHYEWIELALQIHDADRDGHAPVDDDACVGEALLDGAPILSPLAWPLAYRWPVHHLGPQYTPDTPPEAPTLLLLRRETDGRVRFSELSPLAFRLLQLLQQSPSLSGRAQLRALAREAGSDDLQAFEAQGAALLGQLHASGVVLGSCVATSDG